MTRSRRKRSPRGRRTIPLLLVFLALPPAPAKADGPEKHWIVSWYTGAIIEIDMVKVPGNLHRMNYDYRLWSLAVARDLGTVWNDLIGFQVEGQFAKHIEGNDHWELNVLGVARWRKFPWDPVLDTSFAFGAGLSYANRIPRYELLHFTKSAQLLCYVMWEFDAFLPAFPRVGAMMRLHHRSGLYGTFSGVYAGSNYLALGVKLRL